MEGKGGTAPTEIGPNTPCLPQENMKKPSAHPIPSQDVSPPTPNSLVIFLHISRGPFHEFFPQVKGITANDLG